MNKKQKQMNEKDEVKQVENQQNNYFLGSTADIQKLLQENDVIDAEPERILARTDTKS